jgi:hypothetical protein
MQAKWASQEDKIKLVERVRANDQGIKQKVWKKDQAREAWTDPFTWLLFIMMFFQSLVVGGGLFRLQWWTPILTAQV